MIPGISPATEERLYRLFSAPVTDLTPDAFADRSFTLLDASAGETAHLGIGWVGGSTLTVVVTDPDRPVGQLRVQAGGRDNLLFIDNAGWGGSISGDIRLPGHDNLVFINRLADGYIGIPDLLLRSDRQIFFWGIGSTAVSMSVEIEGEEATIAVGDDALVSNGVWLRNYDMHALHDLVTGVQINRRPHDMVIERHVWLGQDALLLGAERVGTGSVIGARSLVKSTVPPHVAVAGTPARVIREDVSWGRHPYGMTADERVAIGLPPEPMD